MIFSRFWPFRGWVGQTKSGKYHVFFIEPFPKRDAWKRHEDMKNEIDKLFAQYYPASNKPSNEDHKHNQSSINWKELGEKLAKKCTIN